MSLREQAAADAKLIIENTLDFGQSDVDLVDPDGVVTSMTGLTGDISVLVEPDTGRIVKGQKIHVTLAISSLPAGPRPIAVSGLNSKPWLVSFPRIETAVVTGYAVVATWPDDTMSTIVLELGEYKPL